MRKCVWRIRCRSFDCILFSICQNMLILYEWIFQQAVEKDKARTIRLNKLLAAVSPLSPLICTVPHHLTPSFSDHPACQRQSCFVLKPGLEDEASRHLQKTDRQAQSSDVTGLIPGWGRGLEDESR